MRVFTRGKIFALILTLAMALPLVAFADANDDSLAALEKVVVVVEKLSQQDALNNNDLQEYSKVMQEFQTAAGAVNPQTLSDAQKQKYMDYSTRLQQAAQTMMSKANTAQSAPAKQ